MGVLRGLFLAGVLGSVLLAGGLVGWLYLPVSPPELPWEFEVKEGEGLSSLSRTLSREGLLHFPVLFRLAGRARDLGPIRAGVYRVETPLSPLGLLDLVARGKILTVRLAVPEGFQWSALEGRLEELFPSVPRATWRELFSRPGEFSGIPAEAPNLEGYVFPETYVVSPRISPRKLVGEFTDMFRRRLPKGFAEAAGRRGLSLHEGVTLASIIERETAVPAERPLIAGVFYNRLAKGMRLQTDPTVAYGMGERYQGVLKKVDLQAPTPYNTYVIPRLPPGPIASPGEAALRAIMEPAETEAVYFVARGDGSHVFSRTLAEHNQAVQHYLSLSRTGEARK